MTPRYALQFGSRLHFKRCQALPKKPLFPFFRTPFFGTPCFLFFLFFLSPAKVGSLEMQPGAKLQAYLGSLFCSLTPACSVLDFESFAGRGQMLDGRVLEASQVEYKPFGKPPLQRELHSCAKAALRSLPSSSTARCTGAGPCTPAPAPRTTSAAPVLLQQLSDPRAPPQPPQYCAGLLMATLGLSPTCHELASRLAPASRPCTCSSARRSRCGAPSAPDRSCPPGRPCELSTRIGAFCLLEMPDVGHLLRHAFSLRAPSADCPQRAQ